MRPILAGLETEYGFTVEGRGAEDQVDDAITLVRSLPDECFVGWDYRFESPRADLRGFQADRLTQDPTDAEFDRGRKRVPDQDIRSDRVLRNGARFYNDHGHPEYSTPECWGLAELAAHDRAGEAVVMRAARAMQETSGRAVRVFKNNTDYHGASYGTHESYCVPRSVGFERLYAFVVPMLVARSVLTGAGKVGSEAGPTCDFQLTQRADFFTESANVDTLYRRPVFNTRDEPHADVSEWIRLHVISGDANMVSSATRRKVGLLKIAIMLAEENQVPLWRLADAPRAFQAVSRSIDDEGRIELEGGSWTSPRLVLESYFDAAERFGLEDRDLPSLIAECRMLLECRFAEPDRFRRHVDWAAKRWLIQQYLSSEGLTWQHPIATSLDLSYHNVDPNESLFWAMVQSEEIEDSVGSVESELREAHVCEPTRALVRSILVSRFRESIVSLSWGVATLRAGDEILHVPMPPDRLYSEELADAETIEQFVTLLRRETQ